MSIITNIRDLKLILILIPWLFVMIDVILIRRITNKNVTQNRTRQY